MLVSDFDYSLPAELIAQSPAEPRDSSRLLVYSRATRNISHYQVRDLPEILPTPYQIVANNSRVRHSRLHAQNETGKRFEILVVERLSHSQYECLIGGRGLQVHEILRSGRLCARVIAITPGEAMTTFLLEFSGEEDVEAAFQRMAELPLPPYIETPQSKPEQYQTVFAKEIGSAAAPTAGLHFTPELISTLLSSGNTWNEVTLHVGLGTFLPLRRDEITANHLHEEACYIAPEVVKQLNGKVLAVGTTSTRTLESHMQDGTLISGWQRTDMFIHPGYVFQRVDALMTNFHLPKSSLLLLVAALIGNSPNERAVHLEPEEMRVELLRIYQTAIDERYRFYSFGDAMLIL